MKVITAQSWKETAERMEYNNNNFKPSFEAGTDKTKRTSIKESQKVLNCLFNGVWVTKIGLLSQRKGQFSEEQ